ncbi:hypothetical protein [Desulfonatronum sp. SC1]|uniref:hypothetical protein n=1 Tax=Desulfonatronum sp. SC1 TaxID=2109626 RepID=UPI000D3214B5|nr:hypothetical protein [Desulfonatronum sp. SC1]PTN38453.1 hypothetical protein C6366_02550 [Desulfonatronum sp. SC1]
MQSALGRAVLHDDHVTFFRQLSGNPKKIIPLMPLAVNPNFAKHQGSRMIIRALGHFQIDHSKDSLWLKVKPNIQISTTIDKYRQKTEFLTTKYNQRTG